MNIQKSHTKRSLSAAAARQLAACGPYTHDHSLELPSHPQLFPYLLTAPLERRRDGRLDGCVESDRRINYEAKLR